MSGYQASSGVWAKVVRWLRPEDIVLLTALSVFAVVHEVYGGQFSLAHSTVRAPAYILVGVFAVSVIVRSWSGGVLLRPVEVLREAGRMVRDWLPFILCYLVYENFHDMTNLIHGPQTLDRPLAYSDELLFGVQPTLWLQRITTPVLTDVLAFCYTLYIVLPGILLGVCYFQKQMKEFRLLMLAVILCTYCGFLGYMLVPAVGPRAILDMRYIDPMYLNGVFLYRPFSGMWNNLQSFQRDCFPSLHTAMSSVVLICAFKFQRIVRGNRTMFWIFLPFVVGLWFSTVYLRYHWFVDVVAGWCTAAFSVWTAGKIEAGWRRLVSGRYEPPKSSMT